MFDPLREFAKDSVRLVKRCHKPDRKGFGFTPVAFPPLLQEYLQAFGNNNNSGFNGGNDGGNDNNFGLHGAFTIDGSVPGIDGGGRRTEDDASGSGLIDYSGGGV